VSPNGKYYGPFNKGKQFSGFNCTKATFLLAGVLTLLSENVQVSITFSAQINPL
jgi:hypothetical protein